MSLLMKECRSAAGYRPGKTEVEYEKPKLHHVGRMPTFEQRERVLRELRAPVPEFHMKPNFKRSRDRWGNIRMKPISGQRRHVVERRVTKTIMSLDGRTPKHPIMVLQKNKETVKLEHVIQTTLFPVQAPVRLRAGSPKRIYRDLKRLERKHGLESIYAGMLKP